MASRMTMASPGRPLGCGRCSLANLMHSSAGPGGDHGARGRLLGRRLRHAPGSATTGPAIRQASRMRDSSGSSAAAAPDPAGVRRRPGAVHRPRRRHRHGGRPKCPALTGEREANLQALSCFSYRTELRLTAEHGMNTSMVICVQHRACSSELSPGGDHRRSRRSSGGRRVHISYQCAEQCRRTAPGTVTAPTTSISRSSWPSSPASWSALSRRGSGWPSSCDAFE